MLCSDFFHFTHYSSIGHIIDKRILAGFRVSHPAQCIAGVHAIHHRNSSAAAFIHQLARCAAIARIHEMIAVQFQSLHCRPAEGARQIFQPAGTASAGRTSPALTLKSQKSDIFLRKSCLLLVGACIAGPLKVCFAFGTPAAHLSGRKHFPITKKDPQTKPFAGLSSWCIISGSV